MKHFMLLVLVGGLLLSGACAPNSVSESAIPAHFTTYTDELGRFSISYPPDWELASSIFIEGLTQDIGDWAMGTESEGSLAGGKVVFAGGVPYETGYNPHVLIVVIPSGEGSWELENLVAAVVQRGYMNITEEYYELSRTNTVVDGREAIILDCEAKYPFSGEVHFSQMYLHDNNLLWVCTCGVTPPKDFSDFEDDFYAIVKSLRTH